MRRFKRILATLLVLCMMISALPINALAAGTEPAPSAATDAEQLKIVHLDCGRKYFSVNWIKALINEMSADGYTHLQLAFGNDGLRFLLKDMSFGKYTNKEVTRAIKEGNRIYYADPNGNALKEEQMDEIIAHAKSKNIEIIPLLNTPGHMDALLHAANTLLGTNVAYGNESRKSVRTVDVTNEAGVNFTKAVVQKYIKYFADNGCKYFNIGADEYANDVFETGGMGFAQLERAGQYGDFVKYLNSMIALVKDAGMTPMAFNDGVYYHEDWNFEVDQIDTSLVVQYWSSGWGGYNVASAAYLAEKGFPMVNFNGSHYYVLGKEDTFDNGYTSAQSFTKTGFAGGTVINPVGSAFAIWCDYPGNESEQVVAEKVRLPMRAMAKAMDDKHSEINNMDESVVAYGFNADGTINNGSVAPEPPVPDPEPEHQEREITVKVGQQVTDTFNGRDCTMNAEDQWAKVSVTYQPGSSEVRYEKVSEIISSEKYLIENTRANKLLSNEEYYASKADQGRKLNGTIWNPLAENLWTITKTDNGYTIQDQNGKYLSIPADKATMDSSKQIISIAKNGATWTIDQDGSYLNDFRNRATWAAGWQDPAGKDDSGSQWNLYRQIPASEGTNTVTFTGKQEGTTHANVGPIRYTIHVLPADPAPIAEPLQVEHWITNRPVTPSDKHFSATREMLGSTATYEYFYTKLAADRVHSANGVEVRKLFNGTGTQGGNPMVLWQLRCLPRGEHQSADGGRDQTKAGTKMNYIRYWDNQWSYYDGSKWTVIKDSDQIVAYYVQKTTVTDEVTTYVTDWGEPYSTWTNGHWFWDSYVANGSKFCYVDFAVVYESGDQTPATFPVNNTLFYHADPAPRTIGSIFFGETSQYEIWKITTTDGKSTGYTGSGIWTHLEKDDFNPGYDDTTENIVWTEDEGTKPHVDSLTMNNREGKLVKIYVRAKRTAEQLTIHYVDQKGNTEFHTSSIAVESGTAFDRNFGMNAGYTDINQALHDNTVTNFNGKQESVKANLGQIPELKDKYGNSNYTLVETSRSDDGKEVTLYYTFDNTHHFVADFGLPIRIDRDALGLIGENAQATATQGKYGTTEVVNNEYLLYTPTKVLDTVDSFTMKIGQADHVVYIHPASNVLYEEGFMTPESGNPGRVEWATQTANKGNDQQSNTNEAPYGYDAAYADSMGMAMGQNYNVTLSADSAHNKAEVMKFNFTGTGLDLIGACGPQTGTMMVKIINRGTDKVAKAFMIDTSFTRGNIQQVPLLHTMLAETETAYAVEIRGICLAPRAASTMSAAGNGGFVVTPELYEMMLEMGLSDEDMENMEFIGMEDTLGASTLSLDAAPAAATASNSQTLSVDGFRVYHATKNETYATEEQNVVYTNVMADGITGNITAFIDNRNGNFAVSEYEKMGGPENEIYLAPGQAIAIQLSSNATNAQISARAVEGAAQMTINQPGKAVALNHNTEMYYKVDVQDHMIVVANTGNSLLALGNVKASSGITAINDQHQTRAVAMVMAMFDRPEPEPETNNDFLVFFELDKWGYSWDDETPRSMTKQFTVTEEDGGIIAPAMHPGEGYKLVRWQAVDQDLTLAEREVLTVQAMENSADWTGKERIVIFRPVVEKVFAPEHFDIQLTVEKGYFAQYVNVNVEASADVAYITVNGKRVDANNADWVDAGFDKYLFFVTDLELRRNDEVSIKVIAYDEAGNASEVFLAKK